MLEHAIITINEAGALEEVHARRIIDENGVLINGSDAPVQFVFGKNVTYSSPEFWHVLLGDYIRSVINRSKTMTTRTEVDDLAKILNDRFTFAPMPAPDAPDVGTMSRLAHRAAGVVGVTVAGLFFLGLSHKSSASGLPERAERYGKRAQNLLDLGQS